MEQNAAFDAVREAFDLMGDWEDRYAYLIDLGRHLPAYPDAARDAAHLVPGCTAQVWMTHHWEKSPRGDRLMMDVDSDALLVKGLLAVLMARYNGLTAVEIMAPDADPHTVFGPLALAGHLSPNRRNGFFAVASRIRQLAAASLPERTAAPR
ncbi:MAG: SufE family protein [Alphaproteobacteria bacterium]|nr:SufE family protein [Alphaproteobacteria bacterium]USO07489.1 MAG: SufE family protein [Rhodospirillales bacterium]